jgi:hypothetical protein
MDLFHNEIISFCLRKATIKLAALCIWKENLTFFKEYEFVEILLNKLPLAAYHNGFLLWSFPEKSLR